MGSQPRRTQRRIKNARSASSLETAGQGVQARNGRNKSFWEGWAGEERNTPTGRKCLIGHVQSRLWEFAMPWAILMPCPGYVHHSGRVLEIHRQLNGVAREMGRSALERTREQGRPCFHWEKKMENVYVEKMMEVRKCVHRLTARKHLQRPRNSVKLRLVIRLLPDRKWMWETRTWPPTAQPGPPAPGQDLPEEKAGAPGSAHPAYFGTFRLLSNGPRGNASVSQGARGKWELGLGTLFWELSSKAQPCGSCAWHSTTALTGSRNDQPCSHRCPERQTLQEKKSSVVSLKRANSECLLPQGESTVSPVGQLGSEACYFSLCTFFKMTARWPWHAGYLQTLCSKPERSRCVVLS